MSKIFLQYAWIKEYHGIKNIEFNFSNKFTISYDKKHKLTLSDSSLSYIDEFFGTNIDICAIVGKNGSGKTSIIRFLFDLFNNRIDTEFIIAFYEYDKNQFDIYYSDNLSICFEGFANFFSEDVHRNSSGVYEFEIKTDYFKKENILSSQKIDEIIKSIYYSEVYDYSQYGNYNDKIYNISPPYMLGKYSRTLYGNMLNGDPYTLLQNEIVQEQLYFLRDNLECIKEFGIDFSHDCFLNVKEGNIFKDFVDSYKKSVEKAKEEKSESKKISEYYDNCIILENEIDVNTLFHDFFSFESKSKKDDFIKLILKNTLSNFIKEFRKCYVLLFNPKYDMEIGGSFIRLIKSTINNISVNTIFDLFKRLNSFFYFFENFKTKYKIDTMIPSHSNLLNTVNYLDFIGFLEKFINKEEFSSYIVNSTCIKIEVINNKDDHITAVNFYKYYSKINTFYDFILFSYGLSSGEMALLNFYSRIYYVIKWRIEKYKSILLFIDEVDMLLHPEWQRKYIKSVVAFFNKIFPDIYFQIILATHSPIMLSDIPKQNILFLQKTKNDIKAVNGCETFASNIFQLFREGFFIGDTGIGVYAEQKLKEIVEHIHNKDKDGNEIKKLISAVGDTFLRNKLNDEYLLYCSHNDESEDLKAKKIAELEELNSELLEQHRKDTEETARKKKEIKRFLKKIDNSKNNAENNIEGTFTEKYSALNKEVRALLEELIR